MFAFVSANPMVINAYLITGTAVRCVFDANSKDRGEFYTENVAIAKAVTRTGYFKTGAIKLSPYSDEIPATESQEAKAQAEPAKAEQKAKKEAKAKAEIETQAEPAGAEQRAGNEAEAQREAEAQGEAEAQAEPAGAEQRAGTEAEAQAEPAEADQATEETTEETAGETAEELTFDTFEDAKDFVCEKYGVAKSSIRGISSLMAKAEQLGVSIVIND